MEDAVIDDMDDIYDEPSADTTRKDQPMSGTAEHSAGVAANGAEDPAHVNQEEAPQPGISLPAIPGLSSQASMTNQTHPPSIDTLGTHVAKDSNPASGTQLQITHDTDADMSAAPTTIAHAPAKKSSQEPDKTMGDSEPTDDLLAAIDADLPKPKIDPEFLEAAKANKSNEEAEWQFDSSDAESSNSSSDTSSEEDSDEEGYEKMDPATLAKMLMAEEGGGEGEDGEPKAGGNSQPRTKNEQPEEVIPKPDVTVTSGMKITALGKVENVVDNYVLIKAFTSGEYQVLESGSVLCLENRSVVGAVLETIGRVQEPFYSVAFTNAAEVAEAGVAKGTVVYYVDAHSTFVFTEPLKNMKGTDASNLHDEEVGEDEMEFSDDEAEAAYKRAKKEAKRGGRGGANAIAKGRSDMPAQQGGQGYTGGAINYDDESGDDELYTPLARPSNLQEMMANGVSSVETRHQRPMFDRGRGRGGRGRGDRGRSGDRNRGGRGGRGGNDNSRRGPSHSFPDRHNANNGNNNNNNNRQQRQYSPQTWPQPQAQQSAQQTAPFSFPPPPPFPQFQQYQQPQQQQTAQQQFPQQTFAWTQFMQQAQKQQQQPPSQHFNFNAQQPFAFPPVPPAPGGSIPAGAFVNPAFFLNQQQQQQPQPQSSGAGPSDAAFQAAQDILRRLQGGPPQ